MVITIGDGNNFQGNVNIGNNAKQIAKDFNQEFNDITSLLDLIKYEIDNKYIGHDKNEVINELEEIKSLYKQSNPDSYTIKKMFKKLKPAFNTIANMSSIVGLLVTLI